MNKEIRTKDDGVESDVGGMIMIPGHTSRTVVYRDACDGIQSVEIRNCASPKIYISVS